MASGNDIGYYTLPVILSFEGVEKQVNSKLSKAFGDVGKKSSKAMADATEADIKKSIDAYEKLRNRAEDALGKVRVEQEKLNKARAGGKQDQIVAAEERYNKALRDSQAATRAAKDGYKDLEDAQRRLGDGTRGLGSHFDGLGTMAGRAGQALSAAGVVAAGAALAGIAALSAGVVVAGKALYDLGKNWDDVTDSIAIKTGTLGPELDKLKNAVKDLAPNTAAGISTIGDAVGSVRQSLHLTGMDLEVMTRNIVDLDRLTGQQTNIRDLGKAFRGFGVDVKDQVGALNSLYEVSTKTGIPVNELISSMVEGGAAARNMGMSFGETAALLATFNDAGLNGDKILKALGIAAKTLAKDGQSPAAGIRATVEEIQNLIKVGNEPLAIARAAKIFGKGYQEIFDGIKRGAIDAQSLGAALESNGLTIEQVAAATDDWEQTWQKLKNTLAVALEPIGTGVFNLINDKLQFLADWITANQSKVIEFFGKVAEWAFNAAKSIVSFVADSLRALAGLIEKVAPALSDIGDAIGWIPGLGKAGDALKDLAGAMDDWPKGIRGAADSIENTLNPALQKGQDYTAAFIKRTAEATKFTETLGDTIATVNDNGQIILSDNSPEVAEKLSKLGIQIKELPDGTFTVEADTEEGKKSLEAFVDQWTGKPIELPMAAETSQLEKDIKAALSGLGADGSLDLPITAGGILGGPLGSQKFSAGRGPRTSRGPEAGLTENSVNAKRAVEQMFPAIQNIGGYRPPDVTPYGTFTEHSSGEAIDVMIPNWSSPAGKAYGDQIAQWALANADALGTEWVIWQQKTYYPDGRVVPMSDRGSPTQNHRDHVHLKTKAGAVPQSMRRFGPGGAAGGGRAPLSPAMPMSTGPTGLAELGAVPGLAPPDPGATMSAAIDTSGLYTAPLTNAYGPGYQPGQGTPGRNDRGEAGYYLPDDKAIRQAQQRVDDANEAIRQANAAVAQAEARKAEMPIDAEQSSVLAADEAVRSSKVRAAKAVRERDDALADLATTQKGEFTKAKEAPKGKSGRGGRGGDSGLGGLGSIGAQFLKDTFGIGDWLPALDSLMPLQMLDTVMGAFMGPIEGFLNGGLNFQNPDWRPGMTADQLAAANAASGFTPGSTSSAPFGIPDIAAPPMPEGNMHTGAGGAPGPATVVNVDQSQNFTNSPLGWDPEAVNKQRENNINRAPRLPVGIG